jgi:hypothetical protein
MAETTHIICAHCRADNSVSNWRDSDGTLETVRIADGLVLLFNCQICKTEYPLPVRECRGPGTVPNEGVKEVFDVHEPYFAWTDYWALGEHARQLERELQTALTTSRGLNDEIERLRQDSIYLNKLINDDIW